jgi:hypothetical protein
MMPDALPDAIAAENQRLRAADLAAEQRYYEAVEKSDISAMRRAADAWIKAGDAVTEYSAFTTTPMAEKTDRRSSSG